MRPLIYVPIFPGTNCDKETIDWARRNLDVDVVSTKEEVDPPRLVGIIVPGGFTYGDYLRAGALAARSLALGLVRQARAKGVPILGICNGFQILCEARVLPGALMRNSCKHHLHGPVELMVNVPSSNALPAIWLPRLAKDQLAACLKEARIPISCGMGAFVLPPSLRTMSAGSAHTDEPAGDAQFADLCASEGFVPLLHYRNNQPGSSHSIAAIASTDGRVVGMMPHPERASDVALGEDAGLLFLYGLAQSQGLKIRNKSPLAGFVRRISGEEAP